MVVRQIFSYFSRVSPTHTYVLNLYCRHYYIFAEGKVISYCVTVCLLWDAPNEYTHETLNQCWKYAFVWSIPLLNEKTHFASMWIVKMEHTRNNIWQLEISRSKASHNKSNDNSNTQKKNKPYFFSPCVCVLLQKSLRSEKKLLKYYFFVW